MSNNNCDEFHCLLFGVRRSVRYHIKRRQFFESLDRFIKIIVALSGVGTFATILSKLGIEWSLSVAAVVAFFSTVDLVIRTSESARLHSDLARRFINLRKDMIKEDDENISDQKIKEFTAERLEIEAEEPAKKAILDIICHNELLKAMGYGTEEEVNLSAIQRFLSQFLDIGLHKVRKNKEINEAA